jgi:hypothetical protein
MSTLPPGETGDPSRRLSATQQLMRVAPIAVLIILGFFAQWELAVLVIFVFLVAIGWSVLRKRRRATPRGRPHS